MSADRVAVRLRRRRAPVLEALRAHPLIVHNGRPRRASRYRLIAGHPWPQYQLRGSEEWYPPAREPEQEEPAPATGHVIVLCPECGAHRSVPAYEYRKIQRRARSGRCGPCAADWQSRRSQAATTATAGERRRYRRWWLDTFADEELASLADALGVETSPEGWARVRAEEEPRPRLSLA